jgi:hypothetical protein
VNVVRPPGIVVIAPRIRAGLDGQEAVAAGFVGRAAAAAEEIRVERSLVLVGLVDVAAGRIRLPDLDQRVADRPGGRRGGAARGAWRRSW